ncbi:HAMP domain-containing sensor histidine kinase [Fulvivirgaceae bacterium BMA10]|uniref:histidine kinase n=1 Tax=Splendidivirga corallicola TaxID=3051826 RepID=A0ABT8KVG8_9BACT|nr:HAMP domain-containing sensor histidine kinase [Fulvivirgaceae bacterium BMA10]
MRVYKFLSRFSQFGTYSQKIIFVAFFSINIPLFGLLVFLSFNNIQFISPHKVAVIILLFTLIALVTAAFLLKGLLEPLYLAKKALHEYVSFNRVPKIPTGFRDEVGIIMKDIVEGKASLDKMMNEKNDITAMLSHDLRSPMISILGLIKVIKMEKDPEEVTHYCTKIEELGFHQLNLMESILSLLNEEDAEIGRLKKTEVNLSKVLSQTLTQFEITLENKQLEIQKDFSNDLNIKVDPYSFSQVLNNLVHNAIKFSKRGQKIKVKATNGNRNVKIAVEDQGIGFTLKDPNILFRRFTPERKRGTAGEPTNGLGLYLSKKIIEKHGGELSAESPGDNKGSTFEIKLPA